MENLQEWLNQEPPAEFVATDPKSKGKYIPIGHVKDMLDEFCEWGTSDFVQIIMPNTNSKGKKDIYISGSVQLILDIENNDGTRRERKLTGGATISAQSMYPNMHWAATLLSLCTANAALNLGRRFGRYLNADAPIPSQVEKTPQEEAEGEADLIKMIESRNTVAALEPWEEESKMSAATTDAYNRQMIIALINDKGIERTPDMDRIIDTKEVKSYQKLIKVLSK